MSRPVTLVAWEDATKKPPEDDRPVWTGQGVLAYTDSHSDNTPARRYESLWVRVLGGMPVREPPTTWCDPTPPGPDALTVEDLDHVCYYLEHEQSYQGDTAPLTRIRAALDALGNGGTE